MSGTDGGDPPPALTSHVCFCAICEPSESRDSEQDPTEPRQDKRALVAAFLLGLVCANALSVDACWFGLI